ncbi:MAG: YdcF family protein [Gammaproteobacteria bacterium]|nr:YdcF family protein [Gammaproteobacteria bacterium]
MEFTLVKLLESVLMPPAGLIFLGLLGLGLTPIWKKQGIYIAAISFIVLLAFSLPIVAGSLMGALQRYNALPPSDLNAQLSDTDAVVVLGGGRRSQTPEYDGDSLSVYSLERVRYAAWLVKRSGLPLIVSGGRTHGTHLKSEAQLMSEVLQKEFIVIVDYKEEKSRTSYENARFTAALLKRNNMSTIALVTHAWHLPRAVEAFEHFGIQVIAAPTAFFHNSPGIRRNDLVPSAAMLHVTSLALHELLGRKWYQLRYY